MLLMHSYTYRGQPLERAARKAREYGYDGLELVTLHYDPEQPEGSIAEADRIARNAGTRIGVLDFSGNLIAGTDEERRQGRNRIAETIRLAAKIGAVGLNGTVGQLTGADPDDWSANGSRLATDEIYTRAAEGLRPLGALAAEQGVWISLEIHMNTPHDTAASTRRLLDLVDHPAVVANLDPGNMYGVADAEPIEPSVQILGPRLGYVHLKNCRRIAGQPDYSWALDSGDIDYYRGLRAVVGAGYDGHYCIEYCGLGDPGVPAERDAQYFRRTLWEAQQR
jgi:3-dehydroshikimate dehydratase